jgi:hypothetical protein
MDQFPILIINGRPASGKSEIIDYLIKADPQECTRRFHVAKPDVLDDFPMLWTWFEEDHILEKVLHQPRLHTDEDGYFVSEQLWHLLIERLELEYAKRQRDLPNYHQEHTTIIEFSRGAEHGGYTQAFLHLHDSILRQAAVLYVQVSFEESLRKNRKRFNPERPDSILEHSLPDSKLERLYRLDDWDDFSASDPKFLTVRDIRIPYTVFPNQDDVTSGSPQLLSQRMEEVFGRLWQMASSPSLG